VVLRTDVFNQRLKAKTLTFQANCLTTGVLIYI